MANRDCRGCDECEAARNIVRYADRSPSPDVVSWVKAHLTQARSEVRMQSRSGVPCSPDQCTLLTQPAGAAAAASARPRTLGRDKVSGVAAFVSLLER